MKHRVAVLTAGRRAPAAVFGLLLGLLDAPAASAGEGGHDEAHGKRYAVAAFLGATHVGDEYDRTFGIEGGAWLNRNWSVGAVVERSERQRDTTLYLVGVGWHPFGPGLRLQAGIGQKDPSGERQPTLRAGMGYEFEVGHAWFLKPYVAFDFIEHEAREEVLGIYFGRFF